MNDPAHNPALNEHMVARLRDRLGLFDQIPVIEEIHVLAVTQGAVIVCCHDRANEDTHAVQIDLEDGDELDDVMEPDGTFKESTLVRVTHQLAAAYN